MPRNRRRPQSRCQAAAASPLPSLGNPRRQHTAALLLLGNLHRRHTAALLLLPLLLLLLLDHRVSCLPSLGNLRKRHTAVLLLLLLLQLLLLDRRFGCLAHSSRSTAHPTCAAL